MNSFTGFSPRTFSFLKQLKDNNTRDWFEIHRDQFVNDLQQPFQELVTALTPIMVEIDPLLEIKPPKKMISRIYRDLRFSKDKSPYRANMWLSFHRTTKDWKEDPTFFFELMPDHYCYGMGFSRPRKTFLNAMRTQIEAKPEEFIEINKTLSPHSPFQLMGTNYVRQLKIPIDINPELLNWYQKKSELYVIATYPISEELYSKQILLKLEQQFKSLLPLYEFFWKLKQISDQSNE